MSSRPALANFNLVRWPSITALITLAFALVAGAESARIIKVLPHYLDQKGRVSLNPSLFERDAYQNELRSEPAKCSGLRFDVQWKARGYDSLVLRVEAKGGKTNSFKHVRLDQPVKPGMFSKWASVQINADDLKIFGSLVSWQATLLDGTNVVAEQKSFLW